MKNDGALFAGMVVFIDKDSIKSSKERQKIALEIKQRGGSVALILSKKVYYQRNNLDIRKHDLYWY